MGLYDTVPPFSDPEIPIEILVCRCFFNCYHVFHVSEYFEIWMISKPNREIHRMHWAKHRDFHHISSTRKVLKIQ